MIVAAHLWGFSQMSDLEEKIVGLLNALLKTGYEAVEGMLGKAPHDLTTLQAAGIAYAATHLTPQNLEPLEPLLDFLNEVGARHVCSSGPMRWNVRTAEDYRRTAVFLNAKGRLLREHGIRLHYHNHEFEFEKVDGAQTGMDLLLSELDLDAVTLCFDAGWTEMAGESATEFLRKHSTRIIFLHLRDFHGTQSVPLGQGNIDLAAQMALLSHLPNLEYLVVEQDPSNKPLTDLAESRSYLRNTFGL